MKTQVSMSKWFVLILATVLIGFGMQGNLSYGAPGGTCEVGDVLSPGQSCTLPNNATFSVLQNGQGRYRQGGLIITVGNRISWNGFVASHQGNGRWLIEQVPGAPPPPPPTTPTTPTVSIPPPLPIYWTDINTDKIQRVNSNSSNIQDLVGLVPGQPGPWGIALDVSGGKMYWTDTGADRIQRANLNGSNVEDLVTRGLSIPWGITLDVVGGKMYWTDAGTDKIQRANLDGSNVEDLVTRGLIHPRYIALDVVGGKMYWTDEGTDKIQRANLDGSNVEDLVTGQPGPLGITLDVVGGKMYWTDWIRERIQRANLDGSNVENFITMGSDPSLQHANLDDFNVEDLITGDSHVKELITTGLNSPFDIALDVVGGKMYWAHADYNTSTRAFSNGKIQRANLNGTAVQDLVTGLGATTGIALGIPLSRPITFTPSTIADQTFRVGTHATLTLPVATGGTAPYTYSLAPIPAGLSFNPATRLLSGTPTTAAAATSITYTARDAAGRSASLTFRITVTAPPATNITFTPSTIADQTFVVGTAITPFLLPFATGGTAPYTYTLDPIPAGLVFDAAIQQLSGTPTTVGTTAATYTATDATGASASLTFTIEVIGDGPGADPLDVNGDGQVTVIDLAIVALFYGTQLPAGLNIPADVNADGTVDLSDLIAVAEGIDAAGNGGNLSADDVEGVLETIAAQINAIEGIPEAPARFSTPQHTLRSGVTARNVAAALEAAKHLATDDARLGKWMPMLKELLHLLTERAETPETTALLPNYPNPFNPETWIPYHLAKDADVTLHIYAVNGTLVRTLALGHQAAGMYQNRSRAAYWDGKNAFGEKVASGVYFYTLTAGDFTATRKMFIRK